MMNWWCSAGDNLCPDDDYLKEKSEAWRRCLIIMLMFSLFQQRQHTWHIGFSRRRQEEQLLQHRAQNIEMHISVHCIALHAYTCIAAVGAGLRSHIWYVSYIWTFCRWQWRMYSTSPTQAVGGSTGFLPSGAEVSIRWEKTRKRPFNRATKNLNFNHATYWELLWKGIWRSLMCYCLLYAGISVFYRWSITSYFY